MVATNTDARQPGGRLLGYARVSTADQRVDLQLDALTAAGVPDKLIFRDEGVSGARSQRPGLDRLLAEAHTGDTIICWRLDRLGRSVVHLSGLAHELTEQGVRIRSLSDGVDTSTTTGRMLLGLLATLAEYEREVIRERVIAGVQAARRAGKVLGRKPRLLPHQCEDARRMREAGASYGEIARHYNLDRAVIWRAINGRGVPK